jgi:arginyl-tRNA--protein-N-Asp/Glu arginylyltransferase
MRRIVKRNADIVSEMRIAVPTSEQYSIFRAYLDSRHRDGGMADMTVLDYAMMVEDSHIETRIIEYRRREIRSRTLPASPTKARHGDRRRPRRRSR